MEVATTAMAALTIMTVSTPLRQTPIPQGTSSVPRGCHFERFGLQIAEIAEAGRPAAHPAAVWANSPKRYRYKQVRVQKRTLANLSKLPGDVIGRLQVRYSRAAQRSAPALRQCRSNDR